MVKSTTNTLSGPARMRGAAGSSSGSEGTQGRGTTAIALGDVVSHRDRLIAMTVERVRQSAFGDVVDVCWFDRHAALHYGSFPATQLDLFPREFDERALLAEDRVHLRSRGPVMRIANLVDRPCAGRLETMAECVWEGPGGITRQRLFRPEGLVAPLMERLAYNFR